MSGDRVGPCQCVTRGIGGILPLISEGVCITQMRRDLVSVFICEDRGDGTLMAYEVANELITSCVKIGGAWGIR